MSRALNIPKVKRWFTKSAPFSDLDKKVAAYAAERERMKGVLKAYGATLLRPLPVNGYWRCSVVNVVSGDRVRLTAPSSAELITTLEGWLGTHPESRVGAKAEAA